MKWSIIGLGLLALFVLGLFSLAEKTSTAQAGGETAVPVLATTNVSLWGRDPYPNATGAVTVQVLEYDPSTYWVRISLSGVLRGLAANRIYDVWTCESNGTSCASRTTPQIVTDSSGSATFEGVIYSQYDRPGSRISYIKVTDEPPVGSPSDTCTTISTPCLMGYYGVPTISIPTATPTPTSTQIASNITFTTGATCVSGHILHENNHVDLKISRSGTATLPAGQGIWGRFTDLTAGNTVHYQYTGSIVGDNSDFHETVNSNQWEGSVQLVPGRTYRVSAVSAPYSQTSVPTTGTVLAEKVFTISCSFPANTITPTPVPTWVATPTATPNPSATYVAEPYPASRTVLTVPSSDVSYYIRALLKREGKLELYQMDYWYEWTSSDWSTVEVSPIPMCFDQIQSPCPYDAAGLRGLKPGVAQVGLTVSKRTSVPGVWNPIATTMFTITVASLPTPVPTSDVPPLPSTAIGLSVGWNNISVPNPDSYQKISNLVAEMTAQGIEVRQVARWVNGSWQSYLPGFSANDFGLEAYRGYFIRLTRDAVWTPRTTTTVLVVKKSS